MMSDRTKYTARVVAPLPVSKDWEDFLRRRTSPFLDSLGLQTRPLSVIVEEAYLQGFADAVNAMTTTERD